MSGTKPASRQSVLLEYQFVRDVNCRVDRTQWRGRFASESAWQLTGWIRLSWQSLMWKTNVSRWKLKRILVLICCTSVCRDCVANGCPRCEVLFRKLNLRWNHMLGFLGKLVWCLNWKLLNDLSVQIYLVNSEHDSHNYYINTEPYLSTWASRGKFRKVLKLCTYRGFIN